MPNRQGRPTGFMMPPRTRLALAVVVAIALTVVIVLSVVPAGSAGRPPGVRPPTPDPKPIRPSDQNRNTLVPASGAYLGAYVAPPVLSSRSGGLNAYLHFEQELGASLQIAHVYHPWGAVFPTAEDKFFVDNGKILLLTWSGNPDTRAIIAGKDDAMIRARAEGIKALGHPIMLEFRHEMDRPNLQWTIHGPADYIKAWKHVRAIFAAVGATNVSWVWCPTGHGFQQGRSQPYFPGDDQVDWIGADVYSSSASEPLQKAAAAFLNWASHHNKPVIIGEFGVGGKRSRWPSWITAVGRFAETHPQVKAMVYYDADGTKSTGGAYFYRLHNDSAALGAFAGLARQPFFRPIAPNDP